MNVVVCIKQVPDTTQVKIDPETNTLVREGVESIINPFDMYAIEEGVRLKEKFNGKTTVITMGPPQAEVALKEAISMGCDGTADSAYFSFRHDVAGVIPHLGRQVIRHINHLAAVGNLGLP